MSDNRSRWGAVAAMLLAIGASSLACGAAKEEPAPQASAQEAANTLSVSLHIEGMT